MKPIISKISVDLSGQNNFPYVRAVQGDHNARYVYIHLLDSQNRYFEDSINPNLIYVVIRGTLPDDTIIFNRCSWSANKEVIVELTETMLSVPGESIYNISLFGDTNNDDVITTFPLRIYVSPVYGDTRTVVNSNEFTALREALNEVGDLQKYVDGAKTYAVESKSYAIGDSGIDPSIHPDEDIDNAKYYKEQTEIYATNAKNSEDLSKSYAVGGTGIDPILHPDEDTDNAKYYCETTEDYKKTSISYAIGKLPDQTDEYRPGEDTDNAKYYSEHSSQSALDSFNQAILSKSYSVGDSGIDPSIHANEDTDNAKYYCQQSHSYAIGGTGERPGEDTDNAKYYCEQSNNSASQASTDKETTKEYKEETEILLAEARKQVVDAVFTINFETGNCEYESVSYEFSIDDNTGNLMWDEI